MKSVNSALIDDLEFLTFESSYGSKAYQIVTRYELLEEAIESGYTLDYLLDLESNQDIAERSVGTYFLLEQGEALEYPQEDEEGEGIWDEWLDDGTITGFLDDLIERGLLDPANRQAYQDYLEELFRDFMENANQANDTGAFFDVLLDLLFRM